jgi:HrpA-like RNA helicase
MERIKLPIAEFHRKIVDAVQENPATIIVAETGAGKSTQVPIMLCQMGFKVTVTQPRRFAARSLAARVASELNCELGTYVGWRLGGGESCVSDETRITFCTDGLAVVRELPSREDEVLVIDEVHEWNISIETLVAYVKDRQRKGHPIKVVIMSATLEAEKLSEYLHGAPVIGVPGRSYPIEDRKPVRRFLFTSPYGDVYGYSAEEDVRDLLDSGHNVLVFQPGRGEIFSFIHKLEALYGEMPGKPIILPLHGEQSNEEQDLVLQAYDVPKCIVATNVAETSITVPDINAVVDTGEERQKFYLHGAEALYLMTIAKSSSMQRRGRAGRTGPGVYIDYKFNAKRELWSIPEILRLPLDATILKLANAGLDAEELEFFHQPPGDEIHEAKKGLFALGLLDQKGMITELGRRVVRLPLRPAYGRMIIEAEKYGEEVINDIVSIAALLEEGGIVKAPIRKDRVPEKSWRELVDENHSDCLAQLRILTIIEQWTDDEIWDHDLNPKKVHRVRKTIELIRKKIENRIELKKIVGTREDRLKCLAVGLAVQFEQYTRSGVSRTISDQSVVRDKRQPEDFYVGVAIDIETRTGKVFNLLTMVSRIDPMWIVEAVPEIARTEEKFLEGGKKIVSIIIGKEVIKTLHV